METCRIGVAGVMGAGKSTVSRYFAEHGFTIIDADSRAKALMNSDCALIDTLAQTFGSQVRGEQGLDFRNLGARAFSSVSHLRQLNNVVHPTLLNTLRREVDSYKRCVLDAALIPLWGIESWFDELIWVRADAAIRRERLKKVTGLSSAEIVRRMMIQEELFCEPNGNSWVVLVNDDSVDVLRERLARVGRGAICRGNE